MDLQKEIEKYLPINSNGKVDALLACLYEHAVVINEYVNTTITCNINKLKTQIYFKERIEQYNNSLPASERIILCDIKKKTGGKVLSKISKTQKIISKRNRKLQKAKVEKAEIPSHPIDTKKELDEYIERNNMASREIILQMRRNIAKIVARDLFSHFSKKMDALDAEAIARQAKERCPIKKEENKWWYIRFISTPMGGMNKRYKKP